MSAPATPATPPSLAPALTAEALGVPRRHVVSSFIDSIGYDVDRKWLVVAFKSGLLYVYAGAPRELYLALLEAESKGRYYNQHVRHHFTVAEAGLLTAQETTRSTAIRAIGYREAEQVLEVEFGSGQLYRYKEVPRQVFAELERAPSRGAYFNHYIRDLYEVEVDEDDAAADLDFVPLPS